MSDEVLCISDAVLSFYALAWLNGWPIIMLQCECSRYDHAPDGVMLCEQSRWGNGTPVGALSLVTNFAGSI